MGLLSILIRSVYENRWGDVNSPVLYPESSRAFAIFMLTDPFPFVPPTWIYLLGISSGWSKSARIDRSFWSLAVLYKNLGFSVMRRDIARTYSECIRMVMVMVILYEGKVNGGTDLLIDYKHKCYHLGGTSWSVSQSSPSLSPLPSRAEVSCRCQVWFLISPRL
jgi:hypothetical protein